MSLRLTNNRERSFAVVANVEIEIFAYARVRVVRILVLQPTIE